MWLDRAALETCIRQPDLRISQGMLGKIPIPEHDEYDPEAVCNPSLDSGGVPIHPGGGEHSLLPPWRYGSAGTDRTRTNRMGRANVMETKLCQIRRPSCHPGIAGVREHDGTMLRSSGGCRPRCKKLSLNKPIGITCKALLSDSMILPRHHAGGFYPNPAVK